MEKKKTKKEIANQSTEVVEVTPKPDTETTEEKPKPGTKPLRNHKDSAFCLLFSEPQRALELFNALTGSDLPPDTEITYTTLENAVYVDLNNDVSFVVAGRQMVMLEEQSSKNENIPLRCLGYASRTIEDLVAGKNIYGSKLVKFPAPEFYAFFVGKEKWEQKQLRLSDAFLAEPKENSLELVVNLVNLNYTKDSEILKKSPSLMGYSKLLYYIREELETNGNDLKAAIDTAVIRCIDEGLIDDFLRKHSREVSGMLFKEITAEEFADIRAKEAYEDGEQAGAAQKRLEIAKNLKELGITNGKIVEATGLSVEEVESL